MKKNMKYIITILDSITETSMPFNEFVLFRAKHFSNEMHVVVVIGDNKGLPNVEIPSNLIIHYVKRNPFYVRKFLSKMIRDLNKSQVKYAFHLHHPQSAIITFIGMIGTGFRRKTLFTVHNTFSGYAFHNKVLSFINAIFSNYITCVSNAAYDSYPNIAKKIKKDRLCGLQNGTDLERIDAIQKEINNDMVLTDNSSIEFVYIARMVEVKNHNFFVDVISKTSPGSHFVFIGAEDAQREIRKKIKELNLENKIEMTGLIPRNEVFKRLKKADVYISPSKVEGLPISVLEAMYTGLPAILSDIEPHKEIAIQTNSVEIVGLNDIDKWVSVINCFTEMNEEERRAIGCKCRQCVSEKFSLTSMHKRYTDIYDKLYKI